MSEFNKTDPFTLAMLTYFIDEYSDFVEVDDPDRLLLLASQRVEALRREGYTCIEQVPERLLDIMARMMLVAYKYL